MSRRARVTLVALLTTASTAVVIAAGEVHAQEPGSPSADTADPSSPPLVAPVVPDPAAPPAAQVGSFWVDDDAGAPDAPVVVVSVPGLESLDGQPPSPWRLSVSVGDPAGQRIRSSLVAVAGAGVAGRAEIGDGLVWADDGEVLAELDGSTARVEVPLGGAGADPVVWVEAEAAVDGDVVVEVTPAFPLADLVGDSADVQASPWAPVPGADPVDAFLAVGPGPAAVVVGPAIEVRATEPPPQAVDARPVSSVVDRLSVRSADPGTEGGERTDVVAIDRTAGAVELVPATGPAVPASPGSTPWLSGTPGAVDLGMAGVVTVDLGALAGTLGVEPFDRATTVSVDRTLTLVDGTELLAPSVEATMAWFDEALAPPPVTGGTGDDGVEPVIAALALGGLLLVGVVLVLVVTGSRRRPSGPAPVALAVARSVEGPGAEILDGLLGDDRDTDARQAPADALDALFADVAALSERVDRIGRRPAERRDPGSRPEQTG